MKVREISDHNNQGRGEKRTHITVKHVTATLKAAADQTRQLIGRKECEELLVKVQKIISFGMSSFLFCDV